MKQYQIKITELAEEDLENAGDYIAYELKNLSAAENTVRGIGCPKRLLSQLQDLLCDRGRHHLHS